MQSIFTIIDHTHVEVPIVLSIPHAGTAFPNDLGLEISDKILPPDDTDWFVDQLYNFASTMGITTIKAEYSRWVIDLNRNPDDQPLYNDGRWITGLCPSTDFLGNPLYKDGRQKVDDEEVEKRKETYFTPYHQQVQQLLDAKKEKFGSVLLWDCHSIRRKVKSISKLPFPDLILGSADGSSAHSDIIDKTLQTITSTGLNVKHNHHFKGGFITRHFGRPETNQHALQLEMSKDIYMDDSETQYDGQRASKVQNLLKKTFKNLLPLLK